MLPVTRRGWRSLSYGLILRKDQVNGMEFLIYIYIHVHILRCFHQTNMVKYFGSLLQCIGQNVCTNFIEIVIFMKKFITFLCFNCSYFLILNIVSVPCNLMILFFSLLPS